MLNESKTVTMAFSLRQFEFENPVCTKFLGVYLTPPNLKFDEHAREIGLKMSRNVFVLRRLTTSVSRETARMAYFALIHSYIDYCIVSWGSSAASSYLFKLQRRAIRVLGGLSYRQDCRHLFTELNILTLPSQYVLNSCLYANNNKGLHRLHADFHVHNTRGSHNIRPDYCRLSATQRGPIHMSTTIFNKLPLDARNLTSRALKARLKPFLLQKAFYDVSEFLNCSALNI